MSLIEVLTLIGLVQGVMLSVGLVVRNKGKKNQNYYFILLITGISLALLAKLLFSAERYSQLPQIWFVADTMAYLIGPLWYLTIKRSTEPKIKFSWVDGMLLLPILYHFGFLIKIFTMSVEAFAVYESGADFIQSFYWFSLSVIAVNGGFLLRSYFFLKHFKGSSFPQTLVKGQQALITVTAFWLGSFIWNVFGDGSLNTQAYDAAFISLSLFTFGMAFMGIVKPASFYFLTQTYNASEEYALEKLAKDIQKHLEEYQSYLASDFSLQQLATDINANTVLTSKAINRSLKTSFSDLVNEYRVKHFLELVKSDKSKKYTHWALAQEAGFGNKVSFYNAFKKLMGTTPKVYVERQFN
ncbi:MAG: helix-turn-helix domain-containing protein [Roseivirga sp.]|nr:helix-turn-helix domain-containing protein [Roseivirga sp.]